ncbi:hypothetical protein J6A31_09035 [bacterium]|nr:hypothetical protein [bacterium]
MINEPFDLQKSLNDIKTHYTKLQVINAQLALANKELTEENEQLSEKIACLDPNGIVANAKIEALRAENNRLKEEQHYGFPITKDEREKIDLWIEEHDLKEHGLFTADDRLAAGGCIGGRYVYSFTPTSIGIIGTIQCSCGAEFTFQTI